MSTLLGNASLRCSNNDARGGVRIHPVASTSQAAVPRRAPACRAQATAPVAKDVRSVELSPKLRKTTAVLSVPNANAPGGETAVYILAMSHVSQKSIADVRELIRTVQPEVVMVELCKDRIGLLGTQAPVGPASWHIPKVSIIGIPERPGYPTAAALAKTLACAPGRPVTVADIEGDAATLQRTGLFRTVKPSARPLEGQNAPMLWVNPDADAEGGFRIDTLPSLGQVEFRCDERKLPEVKKFTCVVDTSAAALGIEFSPAQLAEVTASVMADAADEDTSTVRALMKVRAKLADLAMSPVPFDVVFDGAETGVVTAVVKAGRADSDARCGLEPSAEGGKGKGIIPFRNPNASSDVKVALTSRVPAAAVEHIARSRQIRANLDTDDEDDAAPGVSKGALPEEVRHTIKAAAASTQWRAWTWKEAATAEDEDPEAQPLKDQLAAELTSAYGKLQAKAGDTVGVQSGEAWRVALEEGVRCGASQILLGDRPALTTQRRLAQGIWAALIPRAIAGALALNAAVFANALGYLSAGDTQAAVGVTLAATVALVVAPVALPFAEIFSFSRMSADDVEAAVAVPEDVQSNLGTALKLYGEDALLDWPGARESVIAERDTFMARALAAAARGENGQVPAYVVDTSEGQPVLRYMMAEGAPNKVAPTGKGDGAYKPIAGPRAVVAIIGSAHVRGMCQEWPTIPADASVADLMES